MSKALRARRVVWLIVGLLASLAIVTSAAVGIAASSDEIRLVIDSNSGEFQYDGSTPQVLAANKSQCKLDADSTDGPIMELSAMTFARNGSLVDPAPVGLVGGRLGVNKNGTGKDSSCGRIDWLGDGNSEALTLTLGTDVATKVMTSAEFNLDAKAGDIVVFEFFLGTTSLGSVQQTLPGSDTVTVSPGGAGIFDSIKVSAGIDSNIGIRGGTFALEDGVEDAAIAVTTNGADPTGADPNYIAVDDTVTWQYVVTNEGNLPLSGVSVTDDQGVTPSLISGDDGDGILDTDETWIYEATGTAVEGVYTNVGTVAISGTDTDPSNNTDTSGYTGAQAAVDIQVTTNGADPTSGDPNYILVGEAVTWRYEVSIPASGVIALDNISVSDNVLGTISGPTSGDTGSDGILEPGEVWVYSATGTAAAGAYANTGTVTAETPPAGNATATKSDTSGYFGVVADVTITVTPRDDVTQIGLDAYFDFVIDNTASSVAIHVVIGEDGASTPDCTIDVDAGTTGDCSTSRVVESVVNEVSFEADVTAPLLGTFPVGIDPTPVSFLGGYACGEAINENGPDLVGDGADVGLVLGPDSKLGFLDCAVPVEISTELVDDGSGGTVQIADVGPPADYEWTNVTGVVTIEWDAVLPDDLPLQRTFQVFEDESTAVIPWCSEAVDIQLRTDGNYELTSISDLYPTATGDGDVCLIAQSTKTVELLSGDVWSQTKEAFYVWNDPRFGR
jgi:hypothetical protein